jgi:cell division protein FtsI (penicillin-binding protein 3)
METPPLARLSKSIRRLSILGLMLGGWALLIVFRLLQLQIFGQSKYRHLAEIQQEKLDTIAAPRGAILDRNGNYLAISSEVPIVCVNPLRIPDKDTAAALLASILDLDKAELLANLQRAAASRRGYLVVDARATGAEVDAIGKLNLDWIDIRKGSARSYPNGQLAAHVIGNVDAEGKGVAGIEKRLDADLGGVPGLVRVTTDVHRRGYDFEIEKQPVIGTNIKLTIDSRLQYVAEEALKEAVVKNHAERGSVVAMDPNNGEILALANYPTYDPNERLKAREKPVGRENYAVVAPFEPGSVFKVVTLSAALETTNLRPETIINCGNGVLRIGSRVIHDHKPYAALPVQDVLAFSSNIGAIRIGMQVGNANMYQYSRNFGFGQRTGIELPAEAPGLVRPLKRWQPASIGSVAMGHEVSVTSLQLAQAGAVFANGGFLVRPHILINDQGPARPETVRGREKPLRVLQPETVITMRRMMERVVTEKGGTGYGRAHILGYSTAGKTGTGQIFDFEHHIYTHRYNASFLGFAPVVNPRVLVVVTVAGTSGEAGYGGLAASPAFKTVASEALRLMGIPRDLPGELDDQNQDVKLAQLPDSTNRDVEDDVAIAALGEGPSPEDERAARAESPAETTTSSLTMVVAPPKTPNFLGKSVRVVVEEAAEQGVVVETKGDGLAHIQRPAPGEPLLPGTAVRILFTR